MVNKRNKKKKEEKEKDDSKNWDDVLEKFSQKYGKHTFMSHGQQEEKKHILTFDQIFADDNKNQLSEEEIYQKEMKMKEDQERKQFGKVYQKYHHNPYTEESHSPIFVNAMESVGPIPSM